MTSSTALSRHKLSIDDYHRMGRAGILREDSRVELIEGELIDMAPIGSLHASVVSALSMFFARHVGESAIVWTQNPLRLLPNNEPQPDIALLKPRSDRYRGALPAAADVLLVIEVADTTIKYDRDIKLPLYARYAIPEAWLIDLDRRTLGIYLEPSGSGYRKLLHPKLHDMITPTLVSEVRVPLAEMGLA